MHFDKSTVSAVKNDDSDKDGDESVIPPTTNEQSAKSAFYKNIFKIAKLWINHYSNVSTVWMNF